MIQFGKDEQRDWELTLKENTIPAYRRFLALYSDGPYSQEGLRRLQAVKDDKAWQKALKSDVLFAYENYLKEFPSGKYALEAGRKIEILEDQLAWKEACSKNSVSAYLEYKNLYPTGAYVSEVEEKITRLVRQNSEPDTSTSDWDEEDEETALEEAANEDTVAAYNKFLKDFPEGVYANQVRQRISQLEQQLAKQYRAIEEELTAWEYADKQNSLLAYRDFVRKFPGGRYAMLARQRIKKFEDKLVQKVVVRDHGQNHQKHNPDQTARHIPEVRENLTGEPRRNKQAFVLSLIWLIGFGILTLLAWVLTPFIFPVSLLAALMAGAFFVYHRGRHITLREIWVYAAGAGLIIFWTVRGIVNLSSLPGYFPDIMGGFTGILAIILLRSYLQRLRNSK